MARSQVKSSTRKLRRQAQGKRPQGIEKRPQPLRRSARLQKAQPNNQTKHLLSSPSITDPPNPKAQHCSPPPDPGAASPSCPPHEFERKRKRLQEAEASQEGPSEKRLRADTNDNRSSHRVETWLQKGGYPKDYFESSNKTWEDIKADTSARRPEADEMNELTRPPLAKKKSAASLLSLRRQALEANTITPTETTEDKSLPYRSPGYEDELAIKGSYLRESSEGITNDSKLVCQSLLTTPQAVPLHSLFGDDQFRETCDKLRNRNEARVVEDASLLIAPSPETLKTYGAIELEHLVFNANERWGESIPITKTHPKPDRCVGFSRSAFTDGQLQKLMPYIGSLVPINYISLFLATWRMYFPFFACEAKSGIGDLDVADKQNAHSMTMAVRGIVELFKLANCEDELHRKILAFSISHNATIVRIYGHYALIEERVVTFYRHPIHEFSFTSQDGKDKWTAYQFTKNVYFEFMPKLHELICSAIDKISPDTASQGSSLPPQIPLGDASGTDLESGQPNLQEMAASAPVSQKTVGSKKRKVTKEVLEKQNEQYKGQVYQLLGQVDLLKQQSSSNANSGNDSDVVTMLRLELERQRQESERQRQESERERRESERERQESERERQEMKDQMERQRQEMKEQMERQRQEMKEQMERQRQDSEQQISKLTDILSASAAQSQKGRKK